MMSTFLKQVLKNFHKALVLVTFFLLNTANAHAYVYGEHKLIGDRAFRLAMQQMIDEGRSPLLLQLLRNITTRKGDDAIFTGLTAPGAAYGVTYGMLNGLSGDHESDPLLLETLLKDPGSRIGRIIMLHQAYLDKGFKAAPDGELVKADFSYVLLAAVNLSHFYAYGRSFAGHLKGFDLASVRAAKDNAGLIALMKVLEHGNAIRMYTSLHLLAMGLAEQAAGQARLNPDSARHLLQRALFINAFADHFLEDSFSAGHLIVNRTMLASFTNNKALHDFYCEHGTMVVNRKGEIWMAYGDGYLDAKNATGARIIRAVQSSVAEVFSAFNGSFADSGYIPTLDRIPSSAESQPMYLITSLTALQLVPIPYNSDLETIIPATVPVTDSMKKTNQLLYYRNFIRSRVGNSLVIGQLNNVSQNVAGTGFEVRVNALNFSRHYAYNPVGGKKGMLDTWHGYTLAYQLTTSHDNRPGIFSTQFTGGLRSNFDYWLSDTRFLGLYTYLEGGVRFEDHRADAVLAPSVGINLGSLFRINYYNMPAWLRIPVMYLLPLKMRYGTEFTFRRPPQQHVTIELDLFF